jgi:FkbM family methyltransferase
MKTIKRGIRDAIERIAGYEIQRIGSGSYAFINSTRAVEVWSSYRSQLREMLERLKIDLVIDVGANQGQFGTALRQFYSGAIMSFEPVSSAYEVCKRHADASGNWQVFKLALGEAPAEQPIFVSNRTVFSSLLKANDYSAQKFGADSEQSTQEIISIKRLDDFAREANLPLAGKRIFLKLDTQGYDQHAFRGVGALLSQVQMMQSEVSVIPIYEGMPRWTDAIASYENAGFGVCGMFPVSRDAGRVIEFDCLLARPQA